MYRNMITTNIALKIHSMNVSNNIAQTNRLSAPKGFELKIYVHVYD